MKKTEGKKTADLFVINSCMVTDNEEKKMFELKTNVYGQGRTNG